MPINGLAEPKPDEPPRTGGHLSALVQSVVLADESFPRAMWPTNQSKSATPRVAYRAALTDEGKGVAIIRVVELEGSAAASSIAWSSSYGSDKEAVTRFHWLDAHPAACARLGHRAHIFGPSEVLSQVESAVEADRVRLEAKRARLVDEAAEERRRAEEEAAEAKSIDSWLVDRKGQFGLNLKRGDAKEAFWVILFREKWERERFRDWFRWQRHQFAEWAEFLETHEGIELERLLLAEMLQTERAMKKAGLSDGGRRPLRFWRGDQ